MGSPGQGTAVTAAAVNKAANAADTAATSIRTQVNTTVDLMMGQASSFTGAAGSTFRRVLGEFATDMDKYVLQKLEELANNTRVASNRLFGTDDTASATIGNSVHTGVSRGLG
jgi:uncharacterized protein YukE